MSRSLSVPFAVALFLASATTLAQDAVLSPPPGWVESAPPGLVACGPGMEPQLTLAEYRKFGSRSQVWPQRDIVESDWIAGGVSQRPPASALRERLWKRLRAEVVVVVGEKGAVLDKIVKCTNLRSANDDVLAKIDEFAFAPTRYKGRELITVVPVVFSP